MLLLMSFFQIVKRAKSEVAPQSMVKEVLTTNSSLVLYSMVAILTLLFLSTLYLLFRLETLQEKMDSTQLRQEEDIDWLSMSDLCCRHSGSSPLEELAGWQNLLHLKTTKKIQQYLDINFQQIVKVTWCSNLILNVSPIAFRCERTWPSCLIISVPCQGTERSEASDGSHLLYSDIIMESNCDRGLSRGRKSLFIVILFVMQKQYLFIFRFLVEINLLLWIFGIESIFMSL